jgi:hypothetical protein
VDGVCVEQACPGQFEGCAERECCWGLICASDGLYCWQATCQTDDDCASVAPDDARPCINGVCIGRLSEVGEPCETDANCDLAWCAAGVCVALVAEGDPCTSGTQCASGRCVDGTCLHKCIRTGHVCDIDIDCCDGLVCTDRLCVVPDDGENGGGSDGGTGGSTGDGDGGTGQVPDPTPAPESGDAPVTLPDTGSGSPAPADHTLLFGAGVIAAAAAMVAAKRLRPRADEIVD